MQFWIINLNKSRMSGEHASTAAGKLRYKFASPHITEIWAPQSIESRRTDTAFMEYGVIDEMFCCIFFFRGCGRGGAGNKRVYFWLEDYQELRFDWLISYDVYMSDYIELTRFIFSCEETVISEGFVFLLGGLYGNLVIIWKYYLLTTSCKLQLLFFVLGSCHYPIHNRKHISWRSHRDNTNWLRTKDNLLHPSNRL